MPSKKSKKKSARLSDGARGYATFSIPSLTKSEGLEKQACQDNPVICTLLVNKTGVVRLTLLGSLPVSAADPAYITEDSSALPSYTSSAAPASTAESSLTKPLLGKRSKRLQGTGSSGRAASDDRASPREPAPTSMPPLPSRVPTSAGSTVPTATFLEDCDWLFAMDEDTPAACTRPHGLADTSERSCAPTGERTRPLSAAASNATQPIRIQGSLPTPDVEAPSRAAASLPCGAWGGCRSHVPAFREQTAAPAPSSLGAAGKRACAAASATPHEDGCSACGPQPSGSSAASVSAPIAIAERETRASDETACAVRMASSAPAAVGQSVWASPDVAAAIEADARIAAALAAEANLEGADVGAAESGEEEEGVMCAICHSSIKPMEVALVRGCDHPFCCNCILNWSKQRKKCPLCNTAYTHLWVYKMLDGSLNDFLVEESVDMLLCASWFRKAVVTEFTAPPEHDDEEDYHEMLQYVYGGVLDIDAAEEYFDMHDAMARGRVGRRAVGNRMFGTGGVVQGGRRAARAVPCTPPSTKKGKAGRSASGGDSASVGASSSANRCVHAPKPCTQPRAAHLFEPGTPF